MKANIYSIDGKKVKQIDLPKSFDTDVRPQLIKRAVLSIESAQRQPKGAFPLAGRQNTAEGRFASKYNAVDRTSNVNRARKPRLKNRRHLLFGEVAGIAGVRHGPKAHPPRSEKNILEDINKKEKKLATISALAATTNLALVKKRGHVFDAESLPVIVEDKFETLEKAKDIKQALEKLGLYKDIENAKEKRRIRAGKGKMRGRRYKIKKSLLIVVSDHKKIIKSVKNMEGVDIIRAQDINAKVLAPGAHPGRLALFTEAALKNL